MSGLVSRLVNRLVINADDLGVSRGATLGIVDGHLNGIITSASIAPNGDDYEHALAVIRESCPKLGIGLHFTLSHGKPISPPERVDLLINETGFFRWEFMSLMWHLRFRQDAPLLAQIKIELDAQLAQLIADGIKPDHINGERHVQLIPGVFSLVLEAAEKHKIRFIRAGRDISFKIFKPSHLDQLLWKGGLIKYLILQGLTLYNRRLHPALVENGLSCDYFASYVYTGRLDLVLDSLLDNPPPGTTEIMVHPGIPEQSQTEISNPGVQDYLQSPDRTRELDACKRRSFDARSMASFTDLNLRCSDDFQIDANLAEPSIVLRPMEECHLDAVVMIHLTRLTGLLKDLGPLAIRAFYKGTLSSDQIVSWVYLEDDQCVGFVFGSIKPMVIRKSVMNNNRWAILFSMLLGVLRRPRLMSFLWRSALSKEVPNFGRETTELTYIAVQEACHTRGVGKRLVTAFDQSLVAHGIKHYELSVDASNQNAIEFYQRQDFKFLCSYEEFDQQHYRYRKVVA